MGDLEKASLSLSIGAARGLKGWFERCVWMGTINFFYVDDEQYLWITRQFELIALAQSLRVGPKGESNLVTFGILDYFRVSVRHATACVIFTCQKTSLYPPSLCLIVLLRMLQSIILPLATSGHLIEACFVHYLYYFRQRQSNCVKDALSLARESTIKKWLWLRLKRLHTPSVKKWWATSLSFPFLGLLQEIRQSNGWSDF